MSRTPGPWYRAIWHHRGWFAVFPLMLTLLMPLGWVFSSSTARALDERGVFVSAIVTDVRIVQHRRRLSDPDPVGNERNTSIHLTVRLSDGTEVEQTVSYEFYAPLSLGDSIPVRHLPDQPARLEIEPGYHRKTAGSFPYLILIGMVITALVLRLAHIAARGDPA